VDAVGALGEIVFRAALALRDHLGWAVARAAEVSAVDEAVAVVVLAVGAERRAGLGAEAGVPRLAGLDAARAGVADGDVRTVSTGKVEAVREVVSVVVDTVAAALVVPLHRAAQLLDALAAPVSAVERAVIVVIDAVGAQLKARFDLSLRRDHGDDLAAQARGEDAVWVLAVDQLIVVVVDAVAAVVVT